MDLQSFPHVYVFREESAGGFVPAGKDGGMVFLPLYLIFSPFMFFCMASDVVNRAEGGRDANE